MNYLKTIFGASPNGVSAAEAKSLLGEDKTVLVLDVRQPEEFRTGHIAGATLIPLDKLGQSLAKLPKDRKILCICRSGSRSGAAVRQLTNAGYTALNLSGGMMSWQRLGYPIKQGK